MKLALIIAAMLFALSEAASQGQPRVDSPEANRATWLARSPMKDIEAPAESASYGGGGSSGASYDEWHLRVQTRLSESQILDYYASELEKRGFEFKAKTIEGTVTFRTGVYTAPDATSWHVLLFCALDVMESEGRVNLSLRLTRIAGGR